MTVQPFGDGWIVAVADGVGGRSGGGEAADAAIQLVEAHARGVAGGPYRLEWLPGLRRL